MTPLAWNAGYRFTAEEIAEIVVDSWRTYLKSGPRLDMAACVEHWLSADDYDALKRRIAASHRGEEAP